LRIQDSAKFHYLGIVLKCLKLHQFFDDVVRKFLYTQAGKITPF